MDRRTSVGSLVIAVLLSLTVEAAMFARYSGLEGEASEPGFEGWIRVESYDWGADRPHSDGFGDSRRRRDDVVLEDFTIELNVDKATPKLQEASLNGKVFPKVEIHQTATYGGVHQTYLSYELSNAWIARYSVSGTAEEPPQIVVGNNFEEIKITYTEYDDAGREVAKSQMRYNIRGGRAGDTAAVVPEPSALWLTISGVSWLAFAGLRKRWTSAV